MNSTDLQREYDAIRDEAIRLAGGLTDLAQRALEFPTEGPRFFGRMRESLLPAA